MDSGRSSEIPYGPLLVADRPKVLTEFLLAQRSTEPRDASHVPPNLEWKLRVGVISSLIDTDDRPLPRDFGWSCESQRRQDSSDLIGRTRLKLDTGERHPYWRRKGPKAGSLVELSTLGREFAARRPSSFVVPDETVGCRGVGRGPSQDGLLGAGSCLVRGISFRVPWIMFRPVFRRIDRLVSRPVARSVVVLHLVH